MQPRPNLPFRRSQIPKQPSQLSFHTVKNTNGYWDHMIGASFSNLQKNRVYQLWLCGINCSSHSGLKFPSDGSGNGGCSGTTNHNHAGDPLNRAVLWEMPPEGKDVPSDPTACFMLGNGSAPCLSGSVSF